MTNKIDVAVSKASIEDFQVDGVVVLRVSRITVSGRSLPGIAQWLNLHRWLKSLHT